MLLDRNVVLVGPMGAGKTTIGKLLARELGFDFKDSDKVIEKRCGADIPWIFDVEGESGFRDREQNMIAELCQQPGLVIATGGGAVLREANRTVISDHALVVYLKTSVSQQFERTHRDRNRPLLQTENPHQVLSRLYQQRHPLYDEMADIVVVTDRKSPRSVVRQIMSKLAPDQRMNGNV
ncbi:MAG: shikimate kinase AroK [Proteobacteria bacterium]|nr:MAG: shikimate kinase AroK [Pseudomonadota bacterium]